MRALLSVSNKNGLVSFARSLQARGCDIVSTGGTARALGEAGIPVVPVSDVTRVPEMLDGRVKTLHPAIHGGILFRRHRPDDRDAIARHGITPIDLVVVNLYPFVETASRPDVGLDDLIDEIDIGGPSLVRAAAKNFRDVLVVVSPDDYGAVLSALEGGGPSTEFRFRLAKKAYAHTASYDTAIAEELSLWSVDRGTRGPAPDALGLHYEKARDLRYGENPHQRAAWFVPRGTGDVSAGILQGKELSYNNLLDLDAAVRLVSEFDEPAAVIVKHTNPCGVAIADDLRAAYVTARDADALSAFGGIVAVNRAIDERLARELTTTFLEVVAAPEVEAAARAVLAAKANLRVVLSSAPGFAIGRGMRYELRSVLGGVLRQENDEVAEARERWPLEARLKSGTTSADGGLRVVTKRTPTPDEWEALRFAWRVCAHVKSNAVILTSRDRTLAIGAGQMSRVDAVNVAVMRAAERGGKDLLAGCAAASDAFFPFPDGLIALANAGATAVVQPGGSLRDADVITAADERGLAMVFTGRRHFRH